MTDPLNISFDDFTTWWQGYRIEFSCLYIPQGHHFINSLWLWSTDEYICLYMSHSRTKISPQGG